MSQAESAGDPLIGKSFDRRYEVHARIGKGGMGAVYRATQVSVGREVALKVLAPELAKNPEMIGRFMREAQVASRLKHPNTIVIHDFGQTGDGLFIAMELLVGETLFDRLRRQKVLELPDALRIAKAMAGSLAEAHQAKVVHRDVKPDNIFLHRVGDLEVVKVLDFGIAKFYQTSDQTMTYEDAYETSVGLDGRRPIIGTWQYMAPEQIESKPIDSRADLYALGIVLYEMVAGYKPFQGDTMAAMLRMHLLEPPLPLPETVPGDLALLIHRLLEKDPGKRPQTAEEVVQALTRVEAQGRAGGPMVRAGGSPRPMFGVNRDEPEPEDRLGELADRLGRAARKAWVVHGAVVTWTLVALAVVAALALGAWWLREHRRKVAAERVAAESVPETSGPVAPAPDVPAPQKPAPTPEAPPVAPEAELPEENDPRAWVRVGPGTFTMGAAGGPADEAPPHEVTLSRPFVVRSSEITQAEWSLVVPDNPSSNTGCPQCPVENVNWYEAAAWANALSAKRGLEACFELDGCSGRVGMGYRCTTAIFKGVECRGYRLPTEAEWEYLAKGAGRPLSTEAFEHLAIFAGNARTTRPVSLAVPDSAGLRGILGNVWEWTVDVYSETFYGVGAATDPSGPGTGTMHVLRGCGFNSPRDECRATLRRPREPLVVDPAVGFRLVRTVD